MSFGRGIARRRRNISGGGGGSLLSERVRCPIALADGRLADVEISRCVGSGTVKITIPVRAAFVEPLTGEVTWSPVTLDEIFLPEDFFSEKIVGPLAGEG